MQQHHIAIVLLLLVLLVWYSRETFATDYARLGDASPIKKSLVLFRMNGCPSCIEFMPTWEKLKHLKFREDISLVEYERASMPSNANILSFPTIRFYRSPTSYVQYKGDRTVSDLLQFVNTNLQYS
jgi:hypothetical protein